MIFDMGIRKFLPVLVISLFASSYSTAKEETDYIIHPGYGTDQYQIDADWKKTKEKNELTTKGYFLFDQNLGVELHRNRNKIIAIHFYLHKADKNTPALWKTAEGIKAGSSRQDIISIYGPPNTEGIATSPSETDRQNYDLSYPKNGIDFYFVNDVLNRILITKPESIDGKKKVVDRRKLYGFWLAGLSEISVGLPYSEASSSGTLGGLLKLNPDKTAFSSFPCDIPKIGYTKDQVFPGTWSLDEKTNSLDISLRFENTTNHITGIVEIDDETYDMDHLYIDGMQFGRFDPNLFVCR